jgi:general secretion pathway protein M
MTFNERMQALRDRWERLSSRERTMVTALGVTFVLMVTMVVGFLVTDGLAAMEERNDAMRTALRDLDTQRDNYLRMKAKAAQMETRLGSQPVQLTGYLEQAAKEAGVEIAESNDLPPAPAGKKFIDHSVHIRLRPVGLEELTKFLRAIESGRSLVVSTSLSVRTRDDKHEQFDVEMTVTTYERDKGTGKKADKS